MKTIEFYCPNYYPNAISPFMSFAKTNRIYSCIAFSKRVSYGCDDSFASKDTQHQLLGLHLTLKNEMKTIVFDVKLNGLSNQICYHVPATKKLPIDPISKNRFDYPVISNQLIAIGINVKKIIYARTACHGTVNPITIAATQPNTFQIFDEVYRNEMKGEFITTNAGANEFGSVSEIADIIKALTKAKINYSFLNI